jgi:hypothetical protein
MLSVVDDTGKVCRSDEAEEKSWRRGVLEVGIG